MRCALLWPQATARATICVFSDEKVEASRNFANKIWNAARFILMNLDENEPAPHLPKELALEDKWILSQFNAVVKEVTDNLEKFELGMAVQKLYDFIWDVFCDWYIELAKIRLQQGGEAAEPAKAVLVYVMSNTLKLLHPFMPFITEELWQHIYDRQPGESIMVSPLRMDEPTKEDADSIALDGIYIVHIENVKSIVAGVRTVRNQKNIAPKEALTLEVVGGNPEADFEGVIKKMANLTAINTVTQKGEGTASFMVGTTEYAVPLGNLIDVEAEIAKQEAELKHLEGFLTGVLKKLSNERFVANAPAAVVDMERKKQADAESKIAALKESLAKLKK